MYRVPHLTFFSISAYFVLCLIWQIISFTLPPNEYGCVYAWITTDSQKMPILTKKIIFSDGAHFDLGGYVNIEKLTHQNESLFVHIIGLFFFGNEPGETVTLNGDRYRAMLNKNWWGGYWQYLVSTGRRYLPHSRSYTRCFATCFWRSHYQPQSWFRLATSELLPYPPDLLKFFIKFLPKTIENPCEERWEKIY